jgi:hypothetical protein
VANVYYRSAASWKVTAGKETITLYDDDASGKPCEADPFEPPFKVYSLGNPTEGTPAPHLDSMRIGKGPRVPFSEFVRLADGWFHMAAGTGSSVVLRPLNPEFVKMGKVKLVWKGPKCKPAQLVLQGTGNLKTAMFDVASGKEVEVPAGSYQVLFGRIAQGKGARMQMATIYRGASEPFEVEAGKTFALQMGAPFEIQFERLGDQNTTIDGMKILVRESSGCILTEFHNMGLAPEVLAAKTEDGKGAKVVGEFKHFASWDLVIEATRKFPDAGNIVACFPMPEGYRNGEMVLSVKLPAEGMKVGLLMKKHALFGEIASPFQ